MSRISFLTITDIVNEARKKVPGFTRTTFYRWVDAYHWPLPPRNQNGWRNFGMKDLVLRTDPQSVPYSAPYYLALIEKAAGRSVEIPLRPEGLEDWDEVKREDEKRKFKRTKE